MPKLSSEKDRQAVVDAGKGGLGNILGLVEGHNFIIILDDEFLHGFLHWVLIGDKRYRRPCRAELKGGGWAPDVCELCSLSSEMFDLRKEAKEEDDKVLADEYNERGKHLRANYCATFKAVKCKAVIERKKVKGGGYVKVAVPDFDNMEVGKINLTHAQMTKFKETFEIDPDTGLKRYDWLDSENIINRPFDFIKKKQPKKLYLEIDKVIPDKDVYELEIDDDQVPDISGDFDFIDDLEKIVALYRAEMEGTEEEEYEEEELEKKSSAGAKKKPSKGTGKKKGKKKKK